MSLDISVATNHAARHWLIKGSMCASPTVVRLKSAALPSKGGGKLACLETLNHAGSGQWHSCSARGAVLSLLTGKECCLRGTRRKCPRGKQSTRTPVMVITDALRGGVYFMMGWLVCACAQVKRGGAATWG